jgi:signal transduction histidine kinase
VFELANARYVRLAGDRSLIGRPVREAMPEVAGQGHFELLDQVYRTGTVQVGNEARVLLDVGEGRPEERFFDFVCAPDRGPGGVVEGILMFSFDVTEQVVARRRIEEQRCAAEAAVRARDEFLSVASHELRTPLTTIGLQIDGLLEVLEDPRSLARAGRLRAAADRLEQLVEGMFEVFELEREPVTLELADVELGALARAVVDRLRPEAIRARSTIEVSGLSVVGRWDRRRLDQVVARLLSNALKFGAGQAIHVAVEAPDGVARLSIADRGAGIAPEDHERIFGRYERAASPDHHGGLGLGLWIVRRLVTAVGGTVRVESEPGRGATFIVDLPRQR